MFPLARIFFLVSWVSRDHNAPQKCISFRLRVFVRPNTKPQSGTQIFAILYLCFLLFPLASRNTTLRLCRTDLPSLTNPPLMMTRRRERRPLWLRKRRRPKKRLRPAIHLNATHICVVTKDYKSVSKKARLFDLVLEIGGKV
jgi:hypothetical protein